MLMIWPFELSELCRPGVETFSSGGEKTDWSFQISVILQEMRNPENHVAVLWHFFTLLVFFVTFLAQHHIPQCNQI